jgi:hypothetical protein
MTSQSEQLLWKWTFIGWKDEDNSNGKRASSEPPAKSKFPLGNSDPFEQDRKYVTTLVERAGKLQSSSATSSTTQPMTSDHESVADSSEGKNDASGSGHPADEEKPCQTNAKDVPQHLQQSMESTVEMKESLIAVSPNMSFFNLGSAGHPEFCNRPCIFFPVGQCSGGQSCNFCHEVHPRRSPHLDKINRATLRSLAFNDRRNLLLAAMQERAAKELLPEKQISFLNLLRDLFGLSASQNSTADEEWRDSRLYTCLLRMPLISLFNFLKECNDEVDISTARLGLNNFRLSLLE